MSTNMKLILSILTGIMIGGGVYVETKNFGISGAVAGFSSLLFMYLNSILGELEKLNKK